MTKHINITINDDRKLYAIKKEFNSIFSDLKIEFFARPHLKAGTSSKKFVKSNSRTIADCRIIHTEGHVEINPAMTIMALEDLFRDKFGLSIQIFCKSDGKWLKIAATDTWTLAKQNGHCEAWNKLDVLK